MTSWQPLDLSTVVDYEKDGTPKDPGLFWGMMRARHRNPDDYVSIRHGFTHVAYAHYRHQGPAAALISELTGEPQEAFSIQSIKTIDKQTNVSIRVEQKDLVCICCVSPIKVHKK